MKTGNKDTDFVRLLVLVPHRDTRLPLKAWSASLFAAGLHGAWSFPWTAPLAQLKRPLSDDALKLLAHALRQRIGSGGVHSISTNYDPCSLFPTEPKVRPHSLYGTVLDLELSDDFFAPAAEAVVRRFSPPVLGAALVHGPLPVNLPPSPPVSFRAAALANMICRFRPVGDEENGCLCEWKIGPLRWLPKQP